MTNDELAQYLLELEDDEGRIAPRRVVDEARPEDSPLHGEFEWDDSIAGERYRLDQARTLIRSVRVTHRVKEKTVRTVAYIRDPKAPPPVASSIRVAVLKEQPDDARTAVVREFARAASYLRRARDLGAVLGFADEIGEMIETLTELQVRIEDAPDQPNA